MAVTWLLLLAGDSIALQPLSTTHNTMPPSKCVGNDNFELRQMKIVADFMVIFIEVSSLCKIARDNSYVEWFSSILLRKSNKIIRNGRRIRNNILDSTKRKKDWSCC